MDPLPSMVWVQGSRRVLRRHALDLFLAFVATASAFALFAPAAFAEGDAHEEQKAKSVALQVAAMQNETVPFGRLPSPIAPAWKWRVVVPVSAYNSEPGQTDATPFVTANGTHVRDGVVAANFLKFGTKVKIPQLFGDREFVVADRMNARYGHAIDVWMEGKADARKLGRRNVMIEVY